MVTERDQMDEKRLKDYKHQLYRLLQANQLDKYELKTRYRKSYQELKDYIKSETPEIIKMLCFDGFKETDGIYDEVNRLLETDGAKAILDQVSGILRYPDYKRVEDTAMILREYLIDRLGGYGQMDFLDKL